MARKRKKTAPDLTYTRQTVKSSDMSELLLEYEAISDIGEDLDIPELFTLPILEAIGKIDFNSLEEEDWRNNDDIDADEIIDIYFRQSGRVPLLNSEQEIDLAKRIQRGNEAIIELQEKRGALIGEARLALIELYLDRKKGTAAFYSSQYSFCSKNCQGIY